MKRVVILYRFLPQYRIEFYEGLRAALRAEGVELTLVHGDGDEADRSKQDLVRLEWATFVPNRIFRVGGAAVYWQPVLRYLRRADLVIVEQASRLLVNYLLQVARLVGGPKLAFWGHGRNLQARSANSLAERLKRRYSRYADWWFAYNDMSAEIVARLGFPATAITSVNNAIDTKGLKRLVDATDSARREAVRTQYGLEGRHVGVYVGGLYADKRLSLLLEAAVRVRSQVPDFELIVAGAGPDRAMVERASFEHRWIKYVGPRFGREKADVLAVADVMLIPGAVGLAVLDAFAAGLPLITTRASNHGPEIAYLMDDHNGLVTENDADAFSTAIARVLSDDSTRQRLSEGARQAAETYTVENMVANFAAGVLAALSG